MIRRAAIEPEINDLKDMLVKMGATITIEKNKTITVQGRKRLRGVTHQVMPDRIEFGTYAIAAAMNNGRCFNKDFKNSFQQIVQSNPLHVTIKHVTKHCNSNNKFPNYLFR